MRNSRLLFWMIFLLTLALDQASKWWIREVIARPHGDLGNGAPWPGVFELTYTTNKGIAFGMLLVLMYIVTRQQMRMLGIF